MALGWAIFTHALGMLWRNLGAAIRLTLGPVLILAAVFAGVLVVFGWAGSALDQRGGPPAAGLLLAGAVAVFAVLAAMLWVAVGWHRYVLLTEPVRGIFPPLHGGEMAGYLGRTLLIALLSMIAVVVIGGGLGLLLGAFSAPGQGWAHPGMAVLWSGGLGLVATVIGYRLGPMLPAAAIGAPIGVVQAWRATQGATLACVILAVLTVLLSGAIQAVGALLLAILPPLGMLWNMAAGWLTGMIAISLLTTLHGHFVEGRPLG